jgi:hypothetical protein
MHYIIAMTQPLDNAVTEYLTGFNKTTGWPNSHPDPHDGRVIVYDNDSEPNAACRLLIDYYGFKAEVLPV